MPTHEKDNTFEKSTKSTGKGGKGKGGSSTPRGSHKMKGRQIGIAE
jgi:hypothetical protein